MDEQQSRALREPFPPEAIGKLPRKASRDSDRMIYLDYVGHAEVTNRLLEVDPGWNWSPVAFGPDGLPLLDRDGGLWIHLTVAGVKRYGYGHDDGRRGPDSVKKAVSDALRNAAMRFGVALDLWSKSDRALLDAGTGVDAGDESGHAPRRSPSQQEQREALERWNEEARSQWEDSVAAAAGNRDLLLPLWRDANARGVAGMPVSDPATGADTTLAALITAAGKAAAPAPEAVAE